MRCPSAATPSKNGAAWSLRGLPLFLFKVGVLLQVVMDATIYLMMFVRYFGKTINYLSQPPLVSNDFGDPPRWGIFLGRPLEE
jgi:hypothetical protein